MKKTALFLTLTLLFSCLLPLAVYAEEQPQTLLEVLAEKSSEEEAIFGSITSDSIFVTVYQYADWRSTENRTLDEIIEVAETVGYSQKYSYQECYSFGDTVKHLVETTPRDGSQSATKRCEEEYPLDDIPYFLQDIINGSATQVIYGTKCNVLDVVCFTGFTGTDGVAVYYVTDQGNFVRYYQSSSSEGSNDTLELSENEMAEQLQKFDEYTKKVVAEEGEIWGGFSFISFVRYPNNYTYDSNDSTRNHEEEPEQNIFQKHLALWIAIPSVLATAGGATVFLVIRKKKKQNPAEE